MEPRPYSETVFEKQFWQNDSVYYVEEAGKARVRKTAIYVQLTRNKDTRVAFLMMNTLSYVIGNHLKFEV